MKKKSRSNATSGKKKKDTVSSENNLDTDINNINKKIEDVEEDSFEALKARADENWDKYLRVVAETDNIRKRATRDVENAHKYALENFSREFLAVVDSLEMGLVSGKEAGMKSLIEGNQATLKLMLSIMQQFGIDEIDPHGEPFDSEIHEAMTTQSSSDMEPGSVLTVFQKGYTLNGRLLRPARVVVASEMTDDES
jgi:molecular chaperone GrpE